MKKLISVVLACLMLACTMPFCTTAFAAENQLQNVISFDAKPALYVHAVSNSNDTDAWQMWQCEHDEDFNDVNNTTVYFFLPSSANSSNVDIFNAYDQSVTVNSVSIPSGKIMNVPYSVNESYSVNANSTTYTLKFMKSTAESAIYVNNSDADGNGTDLMDYLNVDKNREAKASGAVVNSDGTIDNTSIKKIKGRGNTTWDKPKKAYNITYKDAVSIDGMKESKKYSILANYQDDSLSRNRFLYDLSDAVNMPYASDSRYVDFYVNGFYWGSYQMTEKIDVGSSNLVSDITDEYLNDDGTVKEDFPFLCEVDAGAKDGDDYYVTSSSGNKITIKSPELSEGDPGYNEVKTYVKSKFDGLFNAFKNQNAVLSNFCDVDSVAKIYLINELGKNWDSGVSSLYFTYKQDEQGTYKFYASPVWDYDNSLGNANGSEGSLSRYGVEDYTEYSGWWCKYNGKFSYVKSSSNIMNNIARNSTILKKAPQIWFEDFVPAINVFMSSENTTAEFMSSDTYFNHLKGSAEMNYQSGWLLNTGDWIAKHESMYPATFDLTTGKYSVSSTKKTYNQNFEGLYNYCADWLTNRSAWLSSQMYDDYAPTPQYSIGDVNMDKIIDINDVTLIQKYLAGKVTLSEQQISLANVNKDNIVDINDVTQIQKYLAGKATI